MCQCSSIKKLLTYLLNPCRPIVSCLLYPNDLSPCLALPDYPRLWLKLAAKLASVVVIVAVVYSRRRVGWYIGNNVYLGDTRQIWLDNVVCLGNEDNIDSCHHSPWGVVGCAYFLHFNDVNVLCGMMLIATIQVRACAKLQLYIMVELMEYGEVVFPSYRGWGWRGVVPLPIKNDFGCQYGEFGCILDGTFYSSAIPVLHAKPM